MRVPGECIWLSVLELKLVVLQRSERYSASPSLGQRPASDEASVRRVLP